MIFSCACPGDASCRNFSWLFPLLNVLYGFLVLKIAGLKLNASNFHKFSLNWFWIAPFSVRCNMNRQSWEQIHRSRRKTLVICFSLWLLRQILLTLILSHSSFKQRHTFYHVYYLRNIFFPKHHKLYALPEIYFELSTGCPKKTHVPLWKGLGKKIGWFYKN